MTKSLALITGLLVISAVPINSFVYKTNTVAQALPASKPVTTLVLDPPPSKVKLGDIVTFTGRLSSNGTGILGKTVLIKDDDPHGIDNILGSRLTGSNGEFVIPWTAKRTDPRDNTVEVYAIFRGYPDYVGSMTSQYVLTVTEGPPP